MTEAYSKVDPEELIIKLKEILEFLNSKKSEKNKKNGKELANTPIPGD